MSDCWGEGFSDEDRKRLSMNDKAVDDLVKQLREMVLPRGYSNTALIQAAEAIETLRRDRDEWEECANSFGAEYKKLRAVTVKMSRTIETLRREKGELETEIKDRIEDRKGDHYGPYGTACVGTGQFDAGLCWKCQIKELRREKRELETQLKLCRDGSVIMTEGIQQLQSENAKLQRKYDTLKSVAETEYRKARRRGDGWQKEAYRLAGGELAYWEQHNGRAETEHE